MFLVSQHIAYKGPQKVTFFKISSQSYRKHQGKRLSRFVIVSNGNGRRENDEHQKNVDDCSSVS